MTGDDNQFVICKNQPEHYYSPLPTMYTFPPPSTASSANPPSSVIVGSKDGVAKSASTAASATPPLPTKPLYTRSPIPASVAKLNLRRRLLLPTFAIPSAILAVPPLIGLAVSVISLLAAPNATNISGILCVSSIIIASTWLLVNVGFSAIERHAPSEQAKLKATHQSALALPFWSLAFSICVVHYFLNAFTPNGEGAMLSGGWIHRGWALVTTSLFWTMKVAGATVGPALGWFVLSVLVVCRYTGPFCPIGALFFHVLNIFIHQLMTVYDNFFLVYSQM